MNTNKYVFLKFEEKINTLIADLGATNARLAIVKDCNDIINKSSYKIKNFKTLDDLLNKYINEFDIPREKLSGVLGVAAPVIGNEITFVNIDFSFNKHDIKKKFFPKGLRVLNDVQMQGYAINNLPQEKLLSIGVNRDLSQGPKILIVPGTGLGLSILNNGKCIATEAGHLNIPNLNKKIKKILDIFEKEKERPATFEDLLSGKGISFIYAILSKNTDHKYSNEDILNNISYDALCNETKNYLIEIFAYFAKYGALITGSIGGVYLSGSISESLIKDEDFSKFKNIFEESSKMNKYLSNIPIFLIREFDLGFSGALEVCKNELF